jgi:uncharacterized membrane protein
VSKTRFEAFSDGVFAFAITLLILGIVLPPLHAPSEFQLRTALLELWPNVLAYALSFSVIGIMWQNHHALFRLVERIDRNTVALNLLLLAGTVFIPFVTSTLGTYPTMHGSTFLYGVVLSYTAAVYNVMLGYLVQRGALRRGVSRERVAATVRAYRIGWSGYVLATLLALIYPIASFAAYVAIAVYYLIPRGLDDDLADVPGAA